MEKNKTGKYLNYAIGEIILVVIGIFIALQLNIWNQNRALKKEELKIMKSLHKEFSQNLVKFDEIYNVHLERKKSIELIMSINPQEFTSDSLRALFVMVQGNNNTFDPYQGIYNSLINSGKVEIISNDLLKEKISRIQDLISDYQEEEIQTRNYVFENLHKYILDEAVFDNFNIRKKNYLLTEQEKLRTKKKYIKIIESGSYVSMLDLLRAWMRAIFEEGPILREEMISIITLLESEIETHK
jgi:hypothetical protein